MRHAVMSSGSERMNADMLRLHRLEAMGCLAAGLAHDLNNVLWAIMIHLDNLGATPCNAEATAMALREIRQAVSQGAGLTRQLLTFGRPREADQHYFRPSQVIGGMKGMLSRLLSEEVRLEMHFGADLGWLHMDPAQLEQIVLNLVVNARDAVKAGSIQATVSRAAPTTGRKPFLCLAVRDEGAGIPPEIVSRIFEPFFSTKGSSGSGLGLAIVGAVVEQNGGYVEVDSEPEKGSEFRVFLPICEQIPADG